MTRAKVDPPARCRNGCPPSWKRIYERGGARQGSQFLPFAYRCQTCRLVYDDPATSTRAGDT